MTIRLTNERVSTVLQRCSVSVVERWLVLAKRGKLLNGISLSDKQRSGHLPRLVADVARRLRFSSASSNDDDAIFSAGAVAHGELRYLQGYTPAMLVQEARLLEVTIFATLHSNRNYMDSTLLLADVMVVADEIDSQLTQSIGSYMKLKESRQRSRKKTNIPERDGDSVEDVTLHNRCEIVDVATEKRSKLARSREAIGTPLPRTARRGNTILPFR